MCDKMPFFVKYSKTIYQQRQHIDCIKRLLTNSLSISCKYSHSSNFSRNINQNSQITNRSNTFYEHTFSPFKMPIILCAVPSSLVVRKLIGFHYHYLSMSNIIFVLKFILDRANFVRTGK